MTRWLNARQIPVAFRNPVFCIMLRESQQVRKALNRHLQVNSRSRRFGLFFAFRKGTFASMTAAWNDKEEAASKRGYAGYSPFLLGIYDFWVYGINNRFFWDCPTWRLVEHYNAHVTANHLEIGPGTGYLLDRCHIPGPEPRQVLCDMNLNCLKKASHRLRRYSPVTLQRDVLKPLENMGGLFRSAGLNYVLHCLPGNLRSKKKVFDNLAACLEPGGVVFGSTLLGREVALSQAARLQLGWLNRRGYLSNGDDSLSELDDALGGVFDEHHVHVHGCVALFSGRKLA